MSNVCLSVVRRTACATFKSAVGGIQPATKHGSVISSVRALAHSNNASIKSVSSYFITSQTPCRGFSSSVTLAATARRRTSKQAKDPLAGLREQDVKQAFGRDVDAKTGRTALAELQRRRTSGSLVDKGVQMQDVMISEDSLKNALEWLRRRIPVDEQAASRQYMAKTITDIEGDYDKQAQELGLMIGEPGDAKSAEGDVYSRPGNRSVLDEMKIYKAERAKQEAERREKTGEAQQERELRIATLDEQENKARERAVALAEKRKKYEYDAYIIKPEEGIPNMTAFQRIFPSAVFVTALVAGLVYWSSSYYTPPDTTQRMWPNLPPSVATIAGLGITMLFITFLWGIPRTWRTLNLYLTVSPAYPTAVSMLGNILNHQTLKHLSANLSWLALFGLSVHEDVGRASFLTLFFGGGAFGALTSLSTYVLRKGFHVSMSGASGGVSAIVFTWLVLNVTNPEGPLNASSYFLSVLKLAGYACIAVQIPLHFIPQAWTHIDVLGHLGGAVFGTVYGIALRLWYRRQPRRPDDENSVNRPG